MNVVIVAGGLNKRFGALNNFAKVILPFNHNGEVKSVLSWDCELFKDSNKYIIVDEKFYDQVSCYIKSNKLDIKCIKSLDHTNSYKTIVSVLSQLPRKDVLLIWSDIILEKNIFTDEPENIIYTKNGNYRYEYNNDWFATTKVSNIKENGNVPGVYFIKDLEEIKNKELNDFVEVFDHIGCSSKKITCGLHELRNIEIYLAHRDKNEIINNTRFFNKLSINNGVVHKQAINSQYSHLIEKEIEWYKNVAKGQYDVYPKILGECNDSILKIPYYEGYITLSEYLTKTKDLSIVERIVNIITGICDKTANYVNEHKFYIDLRKEVYEKILARNKEVDGMVLDKIEIEPLLQKAFNVLFKKYKGCKYYDYFHGDLNGSNILINEETHDIKFIDPRGYFGNTKLSGPLFYEFAKICYCLSGYDDFNKNISYNYFNKNAYDKPRQITEFKNNVYLQLIVGIIYLGLTSYIADNVLKVNVAYQYGVELIKEALNKIEENNELF